MQKSFVHIGGDVEERNAVTALLVCRARSLHLCRAALGEKGLKQLQRGLVAARHEHGCPLFGLLTMYQQGADAQRDFTDFHFHEHRHICSTPLQMLTCP